MMESLQHFQLAPKQIQEPSTTWLLLNTPFCQEEGGAALPGWCCTGLTPQWYRRGSLVWCLWITHMKTLDKIRTSVPWSCHQEKCNGSGNKEQVTCSISCRRLNIRYPKIADVHTFLWKMETTSKIKGVSQG